MNYRSLCSRLFNVLPGDAYASVAFANNASVYGMLRGSPSTVFGMRQRTAHFPHGSQAVAGVLSLRMRLIYFYDKSGSSTFPFRAKPIRASVYFGQLPYWIKRRRIVPQSIEENNSQACIGDRDQGRERLQVLIEQGSENVGDAGRKEPVRRYSLLSEDSCLILALIDLALLSRKEISVFLCSRAE